MNNRFDAETVAAIVIGTILMVIAYFYMGVNSSVPDFWLVQICAVIVVVLAAVYGTATGFIIPFATYMIISMAKLNDGAMTGILFLIFFGVATGHYSGKFMLREGRFSGMSIVDYMVIETVVAILVWVCIHPLFEFYVKTNDLRVTMIQGVKYCGLSITNKLCVCLPVLLLLNRLYKKRRDVAAAKDEFIGA